MRRPSLAAVALLPVLACAEDHAHGESPSLTVTISGEGAALSGFAFPPASANDPAFVDGWDVRFERILVTVDDIVLTENPDLSPTDQSQTGPVVARAKGPWAVDMTRPGAPTAIRPQAVGLAPAADDGHGHGSGKNPDAQPLVRLESLDGDRGFDTRARYGFGFDVVPASAAATMTNLDAAARADYDEMVAAGVAVLYVGTATFKGSDCRSSSEYAFDALPRTVRFRFGFKTPTRYVNCQNSDLTGEPFAGEEAQRGVQIDGHGGTVAQITLHVDHPFWNTVDHDATELFFDQMAARANPDGVVTLDDLAAVDFTAFSDRAGAPLPWRSCLAGKAPRDGTRQFDSGSVAVDPNAAPEVALRHYADFVSYQQSTEAHLNAGGLCAVRRLFPSPR